MKITVFTPTYNRAYILPRTYESIKRQYYSDLEWVVMDDGSSDNTKALIEQWQQEGIVTIRYYQQKNQGRFAAYNNVKKHFKGELVAFLDSDDYFLDGCIQKIADTWNSVSNQSELSGIICYIETTDGKLVGTEFPEHLKSERIYTLYDKYKMKGDKFLVFRNDLIQKYEYPLFTGEKFSGDSILFNRINDECPMLLLREKLYFREYLDDGLTKNMLRHHVNSKNGMREHYKDALVHEKYNQLSILKHCIGFVAFSKLSEKSFSQIMKETPKKIRTFFMYPAGLMYMKKLEQYDA